MLPWSHLITEALEFVRSAPADSLVALLWLTLMVEVPRYSLGLQATAAALLFVRSRGRVPLPFRPRVSILIAGHNESDTIASCVRSLHRQSYQNIEIVCVDDGSTDGTYGVMRALHAEGLIDAVARLDLRGGKSAALNLAARLATTEFFVVVDCDCSFEPDAVEEIMRPLLTDSSIAAVSGNILVRNWRASLIASLQAVEYLVAISLGKAFSDAIDQVSCISGAFGAFRRAAWNRVCGMDPGPGEDFDLTLRLRLAGFRIVFARHSICYTDVPDSLFVLMRQRNRWERDAFCIRIRKFGWSLNPFARRFSWRDAVHQWDFILLAVIPSVSFPFYLAWLVHAYGEFGLVILAMTALILLAVDVAVFACAVLVSGKLYYWRLLPFLPVYGLCQSYVLRLNRAYAYLTELVFSASVHDNYVPPKVRVWARWK